MDVEFAWRTPSGHPSPPPALPTLFPSPHKRQINSIMPRTMIWTPVFVDGPIVTLVPPHNRWSLPGPLPLTITARCTLRFPVDVLVRAFPRSDPLNSVKGPIHNMGKSIHPSCNKGFPCYACGRDKSKAQCIVGCHTWFVFNKILIIYLFLEVSQLWLSHTCVPMATYLCVVWILFSNLFTNNLTNVLLVEIYSHDYMIVENPVPFFVIR